MQAMNLRSSFGRVRLAVGTTAVLLAMHVGTPAAAASPDVPIVASCANPNLPREILDGPVDGAQSDPLPVVDVTSGSLTLRLAVANDDKNREQGLMCVTKLTARHGMIFVFETARQWDFWMKNTLVPLDMVWVTEDGTVSAIAPDVPASTRKTPDDKVARRSGNGKYVIELASGEAASDNLRVGARLRLPPLRASQ